VRNANEPGPYADGNGLSLVVDESSTNRWLLRAVIRGTRCDLGLGSVQLVPVADARDEAVRLRRMARSGGDPHFGDQRVDSITSGDVLNALGAIWQTRPETARRVRQRLSTIFRWSTAQGFRSGDNPVDGVEDVLPRHKGYKMQHEALPCADVPAFTTGIRERTRRSRRDSPLSSSS
jgi:integrase